METLNPAEKPRYQPSFSSNSSSRISSRRIWRSTGGQTFFTEILALRFQQLVSRSTCHEHPDPAFDRDQAVFLEPLIGFRNRQRIGALFGGKGPNGRQHVALGILFVENGIRNDIAQFQIDGFAGTVHTASLP